MNIAAYAAYLTTFCIPQMYRKMQHKVKLIKRIIAKNQ